MPPNSGHAVCTAAIGADGEVVGGNNVSRLLAPQALTQRLAQGNYQVSFDAPCQDVRSSQGWMRFVQVDTLTVGNWPSVTCTVADRLNMPSAVFVACFNSYGQFTDAPFTLMVTR